MWPFAYGGFHALPESRKYYNAFLYRNSKPKGPCPVEGRWSIPVKKLFPGTFLPQHCVWKMTLLFVLASSTSSMVTRAL